MMDLKMASTTTGTSSMFPTWDFEVNSNGEVPLISGNPESVQTAEIAAFLQVGTVNQLPQAGVPWAEFMTQGATFGDLDAAIRQAARAANVTNFAPNYSIENEQLIVTMEATVRS